MFIFLNFLFEIFLFQNCLIKVFPFVSYVDEICFLVLITLSSSYFLKRKRKKVLLKSEKKLIALMFLFLTIGLVGTIINNIQSEKIAVIKDVIAISKFSTCYITTLILSRNIDKDYLLQKVVKRTRVYINIIFLFALVNIFVDIGMAGDVRYGLRSYSFLFTHPTYLAWSTIAMFCIVIASNTTTLVNKICVIQSILILILTFRSKAFMFIFMYFAVKTIIKYFNKIKVKYTIPIIVIALAMTYEKISEYLSWGLRAARPALYIVGVDLAVKYFPFGSGFGTFASSLSGEYYSPIYYQYGLNNVWGLTREKYNYMADTFWPYIYGQFGFIGLIIFIIIIIFLIKSLIERYSYNKDKLLGALLIIMYILFASTAEAIFTDVSGTFGFILIATYLGNNTISARVTGNINGTQNNLSL